MSNFYFSQKVSKIKTSIFKIFLLLLFFFPTTFLISQTASLITYNLSVSPNQEIIPLCTEIMYEMTICNISSVPQTVEASFSSSIQDVVNLGPFQDNSTSPDISLFLNAQTISPGACETFSFSTQVNTFVQGLGDINFNSGAVVVGLTDGIPRNSQIFARSFSVINGLSSPAKVSELIDFQFAPLLSPTTDPQTNVGASTRNQQIYLEGILEIDIPEYWISLFNGNPNNKSTIYMAAGAQIVVKSGNILHLGAEIFSCEEMWKSIAVEDGALLHSRHSVIEDAQYGVLAKHDSELNINHTVFNNNYIGIKTSKPVNGQNNITFTSFYGNRFESDGNLNLPYQGQSPTPDILPFAGMYLNELTYAALNLTPFFKTTFSNLANGIVAEFSNITLGNVDFLDMQEIPGTDYPISGRGVSVKAISYFNTFTHSHNSYGNSLYENCKIGIYADKINVSINDLTMDKVETGVHLESCNYNFLQINNNTINATHTGIFLNDNSFNFTSEIKDNFITMENPDVAGFGIRGSDMINYTTEGYGWDIENNFIDLSNMIFGTGIKYENGSFNNFMNNAVFTSLGDYENHTGYRLDGGSNNRLLCNTFDGNSFISEAGSAEGYHISGSSNTDISCNFSGYTEKGFVFFGMTDNSLFRGNQMWDNGTGLQLGLDITQGNVVIGEQLFHGNFWKIDTDPEDSNFGAVHFGNSENQILESHFEVHPSDVPALPNRTFLPSVLTPNVADVDWFTEQTPPFGTVTFDCVNENICPEGIGWHGFVSNDDDVSKLDKKIAQGNIATDGYDESMGWIAARHLYQKLQDNSNIIISSEDQEVLDFMTQKSETSIGQFYNIDKAVGDAFLLDTNTESDLLTVSGAIEEQLATLEMLDEAMHSETLTAAEMAVHMDQKENALQNLHDLNESAAAISEQIVLNGETALVNALNDNNNIHSEHSYETNEQLVNQIYLSKKLNPELPFPSQDIENLNEVAHQCPLSGGDAVYKARAMLASIAPDQSYDDVELCQGGEGLRIARSNSVLQLTAKPNPTTSLLELNITTDQEVEDVVLEVTIYNGIGQRMVKDEMKYNEKKLLDVGKYQAGIYTVTVKNAQGTILKSEKVVIVNQ